MKSIRIGDGVSLGLAFDQSKCFLGISDVEIGGAPMRSPRLPSFIEIRSPEGIELFDYRTTDILQESGGVDISFKAMARSSGIMEWMLHTIRNRVVTSDWTERVKHAEDTELKLLLKPVERRFGKHVARGFSYQYKYKSSGIPIYRILDRSTWEPGGRSSGSELWFRNGTSPSIWKIGGLDEFYSTEWYLPSCANPNILQFQPFQTQFQGFTFTGCRDGILVTWASEVSHIRTLIEKPRGKDELVHMHEHCGDLSDTFETNPMEVLWIPGQFDFAGKANLYEAVREFIHGTLHEKVGFRRERISTFGMIEEWTEADMEVYRTKGLAKLVEAGVKTVFVANHFQNNMNSYGVSNMCCTVDWKVEERVGKDKFRRFCEDAAKAGVRVQMWGNTALSTFGLKCWDSYASGSPRLKPLPREGSIQEVIEKAGDPFVRNQSGAVEADHYAPVFAVLNLRDETIREYWLESWSRLKDEVGVSGIFLDSSFNLSSDKFHWVCNPQAVGGSGATMDQTQLLGKCRPGMEPRSQILSEYKAHLSLMAEMQKRGYEYTGEDIGLFGISRSGPSVKDRIPSIHMWHDSCCTFDIPEIEGYGSDPGDIFFKGLAYRMMWNLNWVPKTDCLSFMTYEARGAFDIPNSWHISLLKAFNEVERLMRNREILPDERGVVYASGGKRLLWAFEDFEFDPGCRIAARVLPEGRRIPVTDRLNAVKNTISVIENIYDEG